MGQQVRRIARSSAAAITAIGLALVASPAMAAAADTGADLEITPGAASQTADGPTSLVTAPGPMTVLNHGPDAVPGFAVTVQFDEPGESAAGHALDGCDATVGDTVTIYLCLFDQQLTAGQSIQFPAPLAVQLGDGFFGPVANVSYTVTALGGVTDPNDENDTGIFDVVAPVDLQAVGGTATGPVGSTVDVSVGAKNLGPFALGQHTFQGENPLVRFDVPTGTSVVGVPQGCIALSGNATQEPGQPANECQEPRKPTIAVGATFVFTFQVQIDQPATTTALRFERAATLALAPASGVHVGKVTVIWAPDANTDDNVAQATITEAAPTPTATPTPSVTPTTTTTTASSNAPILPVTGVAITGYVLAGLTLIAGGLLAILASRRRARTPQS